MGSRIWVGGVTRVLILAGFGCSNPILAGLERFKSLVHFEVKDGSRVLFWHDVHSGPTRKDSISQSF